MSVLAWLIHAFSVSALLTVAALLAEAGLRAWRGSGRWAWLGALLASALLPLAARLSPAELPAPEPLVMPMLQLAPIMAAPVTSGGGPDWGEVLRYGWLAGTLLTLLVLLLSHRALRRAQRSWRAQELEGRPVLVSRDVGPAVLGVIRPRIVVPEWLLGLESDMRRLMLLHEEQHCAAGDPRTLLLGLLLCAALPWNPLVWWQLHRLRVAMELDCDERVLARSVDPARYGHLLLEVGRRRTQRHLLAAAFAEPRVLLERRVRALLRWPRARRPVTALSLGGAALLLLGFAYATPDPLARAQQPAPSSVVDNILPDIRPVAADTPPPTPRVAMLKLLNAADVQRALVDRYPPALRDAGVGGTVTVRVLVDTAGRVTRTQLTSSSGRAALDAAALQVIAVARFQPMQKDGRAVEAWIEFPLVFSTDESAPETAPAQTSLGWAVVTTQPGEKYQTRGLRNADEVAAMIEKNYPPLLRDAGIGGTAVIAVFADAAGRALKTQMMKSSSYAALDEAALKVVDIMEFEPASEEGWVQVPVMFVTPTSLLSAPQYTPMTVRPELRNARAVQVALVDNYPAALRDAGIGGMPVLWFLIPAEGGVPAKLLLSKSSGHAVLDSAALKVAAIMEFSPAENRGKPVPVWVEIPIMFTAK